MNLVNETYSYKQITATGNVNAAGGNLKGIFVSAATAGTITIYDDAGTGTTRKIIDTFTPVASTFYQFSVATAFGIYVVIGGTVSATVVYN